MKILCISAANIEPARHTSASVRACELIRSIIQDDLKLPHQVEIMPLIEYRMQSCVMCGECLSAGRCTRDEAFNHVFDAMQRADAIFVVCPHYAPLPSKMMILLEKLEEMAFLNFSTNRTYRSPFYGKPVGLVAHGGQTAESLPYYKTALLDPLATAFASCSFKVVGTEEPWTNGVTFGITSLTMPKDSIFCAISHDWEDVRNRLAPLVRNVTALLG